MNNESINIPVSLKRSYQGSKEDKEVFTFAVWIKLTYVDSIYRLNNHSISELQRKLHISFSKAKRIIELSMDDKLFYHYNDRVLVKSFKSKQVKIDRRGRKYTSDYCQKIKIKECTFKELYNILFISGNVLGVISGKERRSISKGNTGDVELTQREIANATGLSRGYIAKITNKLSFQGKIKKSKAMFVLAISSVNEQTVSEFFKTGHKRFIYNPKDNSGWLIKPCRYSVIERNISESFKHVIYNSLDRIKGNPIANANVCIDGTEYLDEYGKF